MLRAPTLFSRHGLRQALGGKVRIVLIRAPKLNCPLAARTTAITRPTSRICLCSSRTSRPRGRRRQHTEDTPGAAREGGGVLPAHDGAGNLEFVPLEAQDSLLDGVRRDEAVHVHRLALAQPVGAVHSLLLFLFGGGSGGRLKVLLASVRRGDSEEWAKGQTNVVVWGRGV